MHNSDNIFNKIAEALLIDYTSVYYVNAVTNAYQFYSADAEFHSLSLAQHGEDFFTDLVRDADALIYEEDKHIFMQDMQKDRLLAQMKKGTMQNIEYRLLIDGKPVYHSLRLIRGISEGDDYFILGVLNIDKRVHARIAAEQAEKEREIYNQIAASLAAHYDTLYYIDTETNHYFEVSCTDAYKNLQIPTSGEDFFAESDRNIRRCAHPEDMERVLKLHRKATILQNLQNSNIFTSTYRLFINGETMHCRNSQIWASDKKHIIVGIENINREVSMQEALRESEKKQATYGQIAESLASHYDVIYYVDSSTGCYMEFTAKSIYGALEIQEEGNDFFSDAKRNSELIVYPQDMERVRQTLNRNYLISALEEQKTIRTDYRLLIEGQPHYTRMTVMWASDKTHFIIGVENIDEEIAREKEQLQALNQANELARRDELTGVKNKNAFQEFEASIQQTLDSGETQYPFAVVICDINNLKIINDTKGHKAGDEYIRAACRMICLIYSHSPVFRIGGDEFAVLLRGIDYEERDFLHDKLYSQVIENMKSPELPVIAAGMSVFDPETDKHFSDVFERADKIMYDEKLRLKNMSYTETPESFTPIPTELRKRLDSIFEGLSVASEGAYVFLCNMKYDFSRWSKTAVDIFGLPSEYMYSAGKLWEEKIHPDDREIYHSGIEDIFQGRHSGHDMQYRARRLDGEYDVCTCRGLVMKDEFGEPTYFGGVIRNHGLQGHIDTLTGLRNLYGFFEDLQSAMMNKTKMNIGLVGISKFSEANEMYGYHFGNRILQQFGRYLFELVCNHGVVYRLDGTKFAVISRHSSTEEMHEQYNTLRTHFRENFSIDDRQIILDTNAGLLSVDSFDVDYQTVYACLNFAYTMSKVRMQGELVEFYNNLSDENKHRIEKLHAIRASMMQNYNGFYLLYQPVVDAQSEELIGAEALLRWRSDEYGMVPPDHFIPILEKDPFFCDLGEWILRTAIAAAQQILKTHPHFVMNVNIAYTQLEKSDFTDIVLRTLAETGFPPEHLCLEITERCRLLDMEHLKNVVVNLRARGVLIALDDFGTGFSSIGVVKNLPFDIIKIDRSFVRRIEEDEKERELIRYFAGVASTFGAKVCVEGIETAGMRNILQEYKVRSFQGYYYSKPLELPDFLKWDPKFNA